jgi:universal stress protein E
MKSNPIAIAKVLVATDFSQHSKVALARAADIALAFHSQLAVVHCLPDLTFVPSASEFGLPYNDYMVMQMEFRQQATEAMKNFLEGAIPPELSVRSKILVGDPHIEVSQFAEKEKAELVVAGRSGNSGWEQFFLGSTGRGLVHLCPTSVMSVSDDWTQKPKTILAGTDFSKGSREAVLEGIALSEKFGAELHLMHVIDTTDTPATSIARMSGHASIRQSINDYAQSRLEEFAESLDCPQLQIKLHLNWGTPWRDMCQMATTLNANLIVVGNVGRRGFQGLFLGNTADRILSHCKASVLAVKSVRMLGDS